MTASFTTVLLSVAVAQFDEEVLLQSADKALFGALYMLGGLHEVVLAWINGTLVMTRDALIDKCTEIFIVTGEYVTGQPIT